MNILIINPTMSDTSMWNQKIPHIGIGYIASVLEQHGHTVDLIDFPSMELCVNDVKRCIEEKKYDVVGISLYFYNKVIAKRVIRMIKRSMECFIFLGGYYPTLSPIKAAEIFPEADCMVIGEGEMTTLDLMEHLQKHMDWHSIPGIAYVEKGNLIRTEPRDLIMDLDVLPFPRRPKGINMKYLPIITSRGCYGRCSFCGVMEFYSCNHGKRRRFRSVDNVITEIKKLTTENQIKCIIVNDETFFDASKQRKQWLEEFISQIDENHFDAEFQCQARANDVIFNYPLIDTMVQRGMTRLFIGLEGFTQRQLDFYQKDLSVETNIQAVKLLHNLKTQIFFGFILFDPLITLDEIRANIEVISDVKLCSISSPEEQRPFSQSVLLVIEGTKVYDTVESLGLSKNNDRGYTFQHAEVEYLYSLLQVWHPYLGEISKNMYRIFFIRSSNSEVYEKLVRLKCCFLEMDLEYVLFLCDSVKDNMEDEIIKENSKLYYNRMEHITNQFKTLLHACDDQTGLPVNE